MRSVRIFCVLFVCLLLAACTGGAPGDAGFDLSGRDFDASVIFTAGGGEYAATYSRRAGTKTLRFTAPDALAGVCAVQDLASGEVTVSLGEMTFVSSSMGGMFAFTGLFEPAAPLSPVRGENGTVTHTGGGVTVVTDGANVPLSLCGNGFTVRVTAFSIAEPMPDQKG